MKKIIYFLLLMLLKFPASAQNFITAVEYWFDTDYAARTYQSVVPQQTFELTTTIGTHGVSKGLHVFNIRFQQTTGYWSSTSGSFFFKSGENILDTNLITAYRYWVDDIDSVVTFVLDTPANQVDLIATLDLSWVHKGNNYLYMQFLDAQNNWSVASVDSFFKNSNPVADFSVDETAACTGDTLRFTNNSFDWDVCSWHFGDGDSSSIAEPKHVYTMPGLYTVSLTITDTTSGVDSTLTINNYVHIMHKATASFSYVQSYLMVTMTNTSQYANSYEWDFGDGTTSVYAEPIHFYSQNGNYTITLTVTDSCGTVNDTQVVSFTLDEDILSENKLFDIVNTNEFVQILFHSAIEDCNFELFSATGQSLVKRKIEFIKPGYVEQFSLARFTSGVYFLRIDYDKKRLTRLVTRF